jgi:urate oxidase
MTIRLGANNYGKSRVRLLRVAKQEGRHEIKELTVAISFQGDFEAAHTKGDNTKILPTDTMKNTVYALARQHPVETVEELGIQLVDHFLTYNPQVSRVRIELKENLWSRLALGGKPHATAFSRAGDEKRTATLNGTRERTEIRAGLEDLVVMKTTNSAFDHFLRDPYTTLKDDRDRILATSIRACWLYPGEEVEFGPLWHGVRQTLLEAFAEHKSESLQHTLYAMGEAALKAVPQVDEIEIVMPNRHYLPADLSKFGQDNPNEIFVPTDEPHGTIEARLRRHR